METFLQVYGRRLRLLSTTKNNSFFDYQISRRGYRNFSTQTRFKTRKARTNMAKLRAEDGRWIQDSDELRGEVYRHYSQIYSEHQQKGEEEVCTRVLLQNVKNKLTQEQNSLLEEVPSDREIFESLSLLSTGKSPGPDGMRVERTSSGWCKPLQEEAESRVLLNGHMLPVFPVRRGVRQGCPLSPLLYILATIPIIDTIKRENDLGAIKPVRLQGGHVASCICFADDFAVFSEIDVGSVRRLFEVFKLVEVASGGKIKRQKSKLLLIENRKFPSWAEDVGVQLVKPNETTRYLGAQLTTVWRGTRNGDAILSKLQDKVKLYSSPMLSFETRVLILKHRIFLVVIHQLMTSCFKKSTIRGIENLCEFQKALLCRMVLKTLVDPYNSLWAPILASTFLGVKTEDLGTALCMRDLPVVGSSCPVTSLVLKSWVEFFSTFYWRAQVTDDGPFGDFEHRLFLLARRYSPITEAADLMETDLGTVQQSCLGGGDEILHLRGPAGDTSRGFDLGNDGGWLPPLIQGLAAGTYVETSLGRALCAEIPREENNGDDRESVVIVTR
ncbi:hypothetical protein R1sor_003645 [Riccia sorocarpa]|uniref:Reverse transcriptase domain-containing protein n=1 Tax=Riccia sorocarpa TaxID=122646 RepID=A0ABD3H270_9MARC